MRVGGGGGEEGGHTPRPACVVSSMVPMSSLARPMRRARPKSATRGSRASSSNTSGAGGGGRGGEGEREWEKGLGGGL